MDDKPVAPSPLEFARPPRLSLEFTPIQYDYYIRRAQQIRADSLADTFRFIGSVLRASGRAFRRIFARAQPAPRRHEPVLVKSRMA